MKKMTSILLAAVMLLSFAACSGSSGGPAGTTAEPTAEPTAENTEMSKLDILKSAELVDSYQMGKDLEANKVRAKQTYCDRPIMFCGKVSSIEAEYAVVSGVDPKDIRAFSGRFLVYLPVEELAILDKGYAVIFGICSGIDENKFIMEKAYLLPFSPENEEESAAVYARAKELLELDSRYGFTFSSIVFKGIEDYSDSKDKLAEAEFGIWVTDYTKYEELKKYYKEHIAEYTALKGEEIKEVIYGYWTINKDKTEEYTTEGRCITRPWKQGDVSPKFFVRGDTLVFVGNDSKEYSYSVYHIAGNAYVFSQVGDDYIWMRWKID